MSNPQSKPRSDHSLAAKISRMEDNVADLRKTISRRVEDLARQEADLDALRDEQAALDLREFHEKAETDV